MPRIISFVTIFFWMTFFAVLAAAAAGQAGLAPPRVAQMAAVSGLVPSDPASAYVFAIVYGLVAASFLWAFATVMFEDEPQSGDCLHAARIAIASAVLALSGTFVTMAVSPSGAVFMAVPLAAAALLATAGAVADEQRMARVEHEETSAQALLARRAVGAAHDVMLASLAGRSANHDRGEG